MIIKLPGGPDAGIAQMGDRRIVKMIPSMGAAGSNCPIIWRAGKYNEDRTRDVVILLSREPTMTVRGEVSDEAYDALPTTVVEW